MTRLSQVEVQARVVELALISGLTQCAIAAQLRCPEASALVLTRQLLRERLGDLL